MNKKDKIWNKGNKKGVKKERKNGIEMKRNEEA